MLSKDNFFRISSINVINLNQSKQCLESLLEDAKLLMISLSPL